MNADGPSGEFGNRNNAQLLKVSKEPILNCHKIAHYSETLKVLLKMYVAPYNAQTSLLEHLLAPDTFMSGEIRTHKEGYSSAVISAFHIRPPIKPIAIKKFYKLSLLKNSAH